MHHGATTAPKAWGIMGEFKSPEALIAGAKVFRDAGLTHMDGYSPFPVDGLIEAMGRRHTRLPRLVLAGGVTGLLAGLGLQIWTTAIDYPINIGARPLVSVPSFIPIAYELTILLAALTAAFAMIALNGLPLPHHPVFNVERFAKAGSVDGFFLCVESTDPKFDANQVRQLFAQAKAEGVYDVEA
jgi:hypothetical protein